MSTKPCPIDEPALGRLLEAHGRGQQLPPEYAGQWRPHALRLATWIAGLARPDTCPVIGLQGLQGSGKSTLAALLPPLLRAGWGLHAVSLSLDDFYRTRAEREQLARAVHPLLRTRGVPGTHDVALGIETLHRLQALAPGQRLTPPRFDKARDDRRAPHAVDAVEGPVQLILLEGWCLGLRPQPEAALRDPVNALEAREDADGRWRQAVNAQLAGPYAALWAAIDHWIVLQAPDFRIVEAWRREQEQRTAAAAGGAGVGLMDDPALRRFLQHYERLSRHALASLPPRADVLLELDHARRIRAHRYPEDRSTECLP